MGWSSGTFTRTNGTYTGATVWAQDAAAGEKIGSARHDTHDQDLAGGINSCLHKGGQNSPTANIDWGGFKVTNLGAGTVSTDAARFGQTITAASINSSTNVLTLSRADGNITVDLTAIVVGASYGNLANKTLSESITGTWTFNNGFSTGPVAFYAPSSSYLAYFVELTTDKEFTIYSEAAPVTRAFRLKDGSAWISNNVVWHAGNFNPANKSDVGHTHAISSLSGVQISTPSDGDVLQYSDASGAWVSRALAAISGVVRSVAGSGSVVVTGTTDLTISVPLATTSANGLLSASDKAKIDTIPATFATSFNGRTGAIAPTAGDYKLQQINNIVIGTTTPPTTMDEFSLWIYNPTSPAANRAIYMLWNTGSGKVWLPVANNT